MLKMRVEGRQDGRPGAGGRAAGGRSRADGLLRGPAPDPDDLTVAACRRMRTSLPPTWDR
ncbi:MAG: hypothetical protein MZV70_07445 [Desulfobacterales bacterium]|nr:hypothetical protein [Desulfobacterales bacterium]